MNETNGYGVDTSIVLPGDAYDNAQMQPFVSATTPGMSWWESLINYGATRAIDNRFAPVNIQGNTDPGSFGGSNGRTYQQKPSSGAVAAGGMSAQAMLLMLAGAAALAFAILR
jgi:hypothetical protein